MIEHWRKLIWTAAAHPTLALSGVRKIAADLHTEIPWDTLVNGPSFGYGDLCYTKAKGRQLLRNYWDDAEAEAAFAKLQGRKGKDHSSVAMQMRNHTKDSRSQGFCMQNTVITMTPDQLTLDIYYRSTELVQKFAADLVFFKEQFPPLFEALGRTPRLVRFHFANVYVSAMFMPIFCRYEPDPLGFFEMLAKKDPRFYRTCGLTTRRFFMETHNYNYKTRVKMFDYWKAHVDPKKVKPLGRLLNGLKGDVPNQDDEGDDE